MKEYKFNELEEGIEYVFKSDVKEIKYLITAGNSIEEIKVDKYKLQNGVLLHSYFEDYWKDAPESYNFLREKNFIKLSEVLCDFPILVSSFKEVLLFVKENPRVKVKVEHKELDKVINELSTEREKKLLDKPRPLDYLLFKLGQWIKEPEVLAEIFLNGKWYVEK